MINDVALIKQDFIRDENITCEGLTVYSLLNLQTSVKDPTLITTNSLLTYILCGDENNKSIKNGIVRGIQNLQDLGIIEVDNKTKVIKSIVVLNRSLEKNKFYIQLEKNELFSIFGSKKNNNLCLFKLFKVYLSILSTFHWDKKIPQKFKGKFCIMSQYYFQETLNIKTSTFKKYIDWFVANKILYVGSAVLRLPDGTLNQNTSNVYSKYNDKELVNDYIKTCVGCVIDKRDTERKNYNAKMGLYYHNYMKRGYKLSYENLMNLVKFCENAKEDKYDVAALKKKIDKELDTDEELIDQKVEYDLFHKEY